MSDKDPKRETATAAPVARVGDIVSAALPPGTPVVGQIVAELRTPEEWAGLCGQRRPRTFDETVTLVNGKPFDFVGPFLVEHEVATMLHGWAAHAHHTGAPIKLTRADYEAALKASHPPDVYLFEADGKTRKVDGFGNPLLDPAKNGNPVPHAAALSPHAPKPESPAEGN